MELKDRLKKARKSAGLTQKDVEKNIINMKQSTYSELERGLSKSTSRIVELANLFGVSTDWLASGTGEMIDNKHLFDDFVVVGGDNHPLSDSEYVMIKQYSSECAISGDIAVKGGMPFERDWLKGMGFSPDDLAVIRTNDDSMSPTINNGQVLLLNTASIEPQSTKIYLICIDGGFYIKRLINMFDKWVMRSDNPNKSSYPDIEVSSETMSKVDIRGRIVWQSGML